MSKILPAQGNTYSRTGSTKVEQRSTIVVGQVSAGTSDTETMKFARLLRLQLPAHTLEPQETLASKRRTSRSDLTFERCPICPCRLSPPTPEPVK